MKYCIYFKKLYKLRDVLLTLEPSDLYDWNGSLAKLLEKATGIQRTYSYKIDLYEKTGRLIYKRKNRLRYIDFQIYPKYDSIFEKFWLKLKCKLGFHHFKNYQLSSCLLNTCWGSIKCGHSGYYCSQPQWTCPNFILQCSHCGKKKFANEYLYK